jgi:hypothetical protein
MFLVEAMGGPVYIAGREEVDDAENDVRDVEINVDNDVG